MSSIITLNTEQKDLSIRVNSNGFSFYLTDQDGELEAQYVAFNKLSPELSQLKDSIYSYPILFSGFRSYNLIIEAEKYILSPSLLFDADTAQKQHKLLYSTDQTKEHFFEEVLPLSIVNCYSFDSEMYRFLNRTFQFNQVISYSSLLMVSAHGNRPKHGKSMFLFVNENSIHIVVHNSTNIENLACYPKFSPMNCTYFALKSWEMYQLKQEEDALYLIGESDYCAKLKPLVERYVSNIQWRDSYSISTLLNGSTENIVPNIL